MVLRIVSLIAAFAVMLSPAAAQSPGENPFVGTWKLIAADKLLLDGTRVSDYGDHPHGIAIFQPNGYFVVQVFREVRTRFAGKDREKGTFDEYRDAQLTASCIFGTYTVDTAAAKVTMHIDRGTYPNNDDTTQVRDYELKGDTLSWRVIPRPDGSIPITVVQRIK